MQRLAYRQQLIARSIFSSLSKLNQFWETDMETQRLGRRIAETMFAEIYQRLLGFYCDTPEQRYQTLMKRCPDLQELITLKEIALFLGVTPETLSRIRKKSTAKIEVLTFRQGFLRFLLPNIATIMIN